MQLAAVAIVVFVPLLAASELESRQETTVLGSSVIRECFEIFYQYTCEESTYALEGANVALMCGSDFLPAAENYAAQCTRGGEGNQFCLQFFTENTGYTQIGPQCSSVNESMSPCPAGCRETLESVVRELGCCFGTIFNERLSDLIFGLDISVVFDACNITASPPCDSDFELTVPDNADSCTSSDFWDRLADYICRTDIGQPVIDAYLKNPKCVPMARHYANTCSRGPNNEFCLSLFGTSFNPSVPMRTLLRNPTLNAALENCADYSSFESEGCPTSCQDTLNTVVNNFGCCINHFNDSINEVLVPQFSGDVTTTCGVESPGVCKNDFQLNGSKTITFTATTLWMCLCLSLAVLQHQA